MQLEKYKRKYKALICKCMNLLNQKQNKESREKKCGDVLFIFYHKKKKEYFPSYYKKKT